MKQPFRRQHERFACDIPVTLVASGARVGEGALLDIGLGGAALRTSVCLQRGTLYEIFLVRDKQKIRLPFRVAWEGAARGQALRFGLSFVLTTAQEKLYRRLIDDIRRALDKDGGTVLRDYWNV